MKDPYPITTLTKPTMTFDLRIKTTVVYILSSLENLIYAFDLG